AQPPPVNDKNGGACLIATAAFGSELSPQVQQLRELRDNIILSTQSGTAFMTIFNQFYYSFSPTIADYEREQPIFKEAIKITLTPMLTSLSLLNHVNIDSEQEMIGYGIGIILMNVGMYFGIPVFGIMKIYQFKRK
ncbi:MAG: copper-binding protein, partial [Nitrosopumilales archaeon CG_4_10_14_0_8_um_filter_34_8]